MSTTETTTIQHYMEELKSEFGSGSLREMYLLAIIRALEAEQKLRDAEFVLSEHKRLHNELNAILHPNGDGPAAPSLCDLVSCVKSDLGTLAAQVAGIKDEISDFCAALDGMLLANLTTEQIADDLGQRLSHYEVPQHHLREVRAEAGRAGYLVGFIDGYNQEECLINPDLEALEASHKYAASILNGKDGE